MTCHRAWALALLLSCSIAPAWASGETEAEYGLTWGLTPAQIQNQGVVLSEPDVHGHLSLYRTQVLPGAPSAGEIYTLVFDDAVGLVKVASSRLVPADPSGEKGRDLFDRVTDKFSAHYRTDPLHTVMTVGQEASVTPAASSSSAKASPPLGFYACLAAPKCGLWVQTYRAPHKVIAVFLDGAGDLKDTGLLTVAVEAQPEFEQSLKRNASSAPAPASPSGSP